MADRIRYGGISKVYFDRKRGGDEGYSHPASDEPFRNRYSFAESIQKNRLVSIQLNQKDYLGRQTESIVGYFRGSLTGNKIFINNQWISLESIRNIQLLQEEKWFQIHVFTNNRMQIARKNPTPTSSPIEENDTFDTEITWIEDFNQSEEWIE